MEEEEKVVVVGLIERATNSTEAGVDPRLMKAIKSVVRYSDSELRIAAQTLMSLMKHDHSQVRYLALLIIDELFMRSKLFRTLLVDNLDMLLSLSVGFRRTHPLPAPAPVATVLRNKAIEFLEKWNDTFGIQYRLLRLGYDYLKNTLRYQFPNLQANAARLREEKMKREMKTKEILLKKFKSIKAKFPSIKEEIHQNINEINEGLDILRTKDEDMVLALDDEEMEEFRNSELRQIRLDSLKEAEKVYENSENKVVFDALREVYKVLVTKHLPAIQEWMSVLIRVEIEDTRFRETALKDLIDIKNRISLTKIKSEELGCDFSKTVNTEEEEDIWEDGTIETFKEQIFFENNDQPSTSSTSNARDSNINSSNGKEKVSGDSSKSESNSLRTKLLTEAPVLNWGSFLDNWASNRDFLANQRGLDLESHWGRVDQDAVIPSQKIAELNVHASVYKEDFVEIPPCLAPLRSGGLCQRRDLKTCPFHGPIVKRDDEGKPVDDSSALVQPEESTTDVKNGIIDGLFNQAVRNVRERDMEEVRKRILDQKSLKRAKLAKVREHNEAVLRDSALATTWRSEVVEAENVSSSSTRGKKGTLASMLKKKESSKQRLARRLMSSRSRGCTGTELAVAEDAKYREAFPNQW